MLYDPGSWSPDSSCPTSLPSPVVCVSAQAGQVIHAGPAFVVTPIATGKLGATVKVHAGEGACWRRSVSLDGDGDIRRLVELLRLVERGRHSREEVGVGTVGWCCGAGRDIGWRRRGC